MYSWFNISRSSVNVAPVVNENENEERDGLEPEYEESNGNELLTFGKAQMTTNASSETEDKPESTGTEGHTEPQQHYPLIQNSESVDGNANHPKEPIDQVPGCNAIKQNVAESDKPAADEGRSSYVDEGDNLTISDLFLSYQSSIDRSSHLISEGTMTLNSKKSGEQLEPSSSLAITDRTRQDETSPSATILQSHLECLNISSEQLTTRADPPRDTEQAKPSLELLSHLLSDLPTKTAAKVATQRIVTTGWLPEDEPSSSAVQVIDFKGPDPPSLHSRRKSLQAEESNHTSLHAVGIGSQLRLEGKRRNSLYEKSFNDGIGENSNKKGGSWSFIGFSKVKREEDRRSISTNHGDSETIVTNNRSTDKFDFEGTCTDHNEITSGNSRASMLDRALDRTLTEPTRIFTELSQDRKSEVVNESAKLGIGEDGEVIYPEDFDSSSSIAHDFLVDDAILAKTLSIYESITEEDGILLESFRRAENELIQGNKSTSQAGAEPHSIAQLKKIRLSPFRETSHESQALFDILDRDFSTVSARITVAIGGPGGMRRPMTAEDVKLCFVAFVKCFTPPNKSHFAQEYNYGMDKGLHLSNEDDDVRSLKSHESDKGIEEFTKPKAFPRPFVPAHIVNALWKDVIKCRFLDHHDLKKGFAKKVEAASDEVFSSALSFLRDTLVLLGVLDVRKVAGSATMSNGSDNELMLDNSDVFRFRTDGERKEPFEEVISVHQDIHQEYGEYLISADHLDALHKRVEKYEKRWNSVISDACTPNSGNRNEASYAVQLLPCTTIRANRFREGAALLADKKFIDGRLRALGILEGTTAQVTDAEELILRYFDKKKVLNFLDSLDPDEIMVDAYEKTRKIIMREVGETEESVTSQDQGSTAHGRQLIKLQNDAGMAMHLMGVSLGNQGFLVEEMSYCLDALNLKRSSVAVDFRSVTISDTLHCIGYSLDNAGKYLQAMDYYDEALDIRKEILGDNDLRVAETLHNKGAILCENGACEEALTCLEEALRIRTLHHGDNHESCADTQQWIGNVMREWGRFDQALVFFRTALQVKKFTLGVDHEEVANTLQNMAIVLDDMEKYSVSLDCYEEALRIYILQFGREDPRVADSLHRMAIDYAITEQNELALTTLEQAIQIREKLLVDSKEPNAKDIVVQSLIFTPEINQDAVEARIGSLIECYEESIDLAIILERGDQKSIGKIQHRLGDLYGEMHDWENAVERFQGALRVQRALADSGALDEEEVCEILHKKGYVHLCISEHHKAKSCFESVIYRLRTSNERDYAAEATSLYCLGVTFHHLKVHKLALVAFTEALRIWTEIYGDSHVQCGYALYWIGRQETELLQIDKALTWYRGALKTFKSNKTDVDYAAVSKTLELLGGIHEKLADLDAALKCYNEGVRLVRWKFGNFHSFTIDMLCRSGFVSEKLGCPIEAIGFFEDAISVMKSCSHEGDTKLCEILEKLGLLQEAEGNMDIAKDKLSEAYRLWEAGVGQDDLRTAGAVWKLGRVLDKQGSRDAAMQCYRECLRVQKLKLQPGNQNFAETLSSMGANLASSEKFDEAIKCFQQALSIQRNAYGDNSLIVASTLHNLAKGYQEIGFYDKSVVCFKEALRISKSDGETLNTTEIAEISFGMALSHDANNNYQAAVSHFNEALKVWRDTSSDDPRITIVLQKLGTVYSKVGEHSAAIGCYTDALKILSEQDDDDDDGMLMAVVLSGLARSYSLTGAHDGAIEMYQRHIDLLKSDSENRDAVADSLFSMGCIYARLDNYDEAILHYKDCLLVRKKCFGNDDERVGRVLVNMAVVFSKSEDLIEAKECFLEAMRINRVHANDREVAVNLKDLGRILTKQNDLNGALEYYLEALHLSNKLLGPGDLQVATLLYTCAATMYEQKEYTKALEFFKDALRIRRVKMEPTCVEIGETLFMIGQTLAHSVKFDEALVFLKEALEAFCLAPGISSVEVGNCNQAIGETYFSKEDFDAAVPFFLEALPLRQKFYGEDDMAVATTLFELSRSYFNLNKWDNSLEYAVKSLRIRNLKRGSHSLECADSLTQIGDIKLALMKYSEAQHYYLDALQEYTVIYGKGHISVAECLEKIGTIYLKEGQMSNAIDNLRRALKLFTENLGGITSQVARVLITIGKVEAKKGASDNAIECFKQSLSISNELHENSAVAAALHEIGVVLESIGKKGEAMECYKETLRLSNHKAATETRAQTFNRIGGILAELKDYREALKAFDKALSAFEGLRGERSTEVGQTIHNMAVLHEAQGDYDKAKDCFTEAHDIFLDRLGPNDLAVALALNNLGINHARRKLFEKAVELCSAALMIRKDVLGTTHLDTCDALYNLATILDEWGKDDEAMTYFADGLEAYRSTLGDEDLEVANCFKCIGILHLKKGDVDLATRALVEALRIYQLEGDENSGIADVLFNLGMIYTKQEHYEKALEALAQCLRIRKSEHQDDQHDIAETCLQIGIVYASKELPREAKKFFERALLIYDEKGKKDTLARAQVTANLAKILAIEESYDIALQMFREATEIFKRDIGEDTEEVAEALVNVGIIHNKRVDYEESLKFLTSGLKIRTELFGRDDVKVANTLFEIGQVMEEWGDSDEAVDTYAEVIRISKLYNCTCNSMMVESLKRLGALYLEKSNNEDALKSLLQAVHIEKSVHGDDAVEIGHLYLSIAGVHDARADDDSALEAYAEALQIFKSKCGNDDVSVALAQNNIGINHARRKDYGKAISLLSEALRIRKLKLGEGHLDVADSCVNIAHVLDEWGKDDQALKFYNEAMELYKANLGNDDVEVANCCQQIGGVYVKQNALSNAATCYVESIRIYRQKKGMDTLDVALGLFNLGRVYSMTADYEKALVCFKECLRIRQSQLGDSHLEVHAVDRYIEAVERKRRR